MGLTTKQIIALLQLSGCGRFTTFKMAKYALATHRELKTPTELFRFIRICKLNNIAVRIKDYNLNDIEKACKKADDIILKSSQENIGIISYFEEGFPKNLKNMSDSKGTFNSPLVLYYLGDIQKMNYPAIAIIGTRNPTSEGIDAGNYFGKYFAEKGFN